MSDNNMTEIDNAGKKLYYAISEVCQMTGVRDNVLRGWEKEFPQLRPKRGKSGARLYRDKDIELVSYIKHLLQNEQYTVPGAKRRITEERRAERLGLGAKHADQRDDDDQYGKDTAPAAEDPQASIPASASLPPPDLISNIRGELVEILKILGS